MTGDFVRLAQQALAVLSLRHAVQTNLEVDGTSRPASTSMFVRPGRLTDGIAHASEVRGRPGEEVPCAPWACAMLVSIRQHSPSFLHLSVI